MQEERSNEKAARISFDLYERSAGRSFSKYHTLCTLVARIIPLRDTKFINYYLYPFLAHRITLYMQFCGMRLFREGLALAEIPSGW